ncbi:MAG: chloramphenicol acetyltransferase [Flavobacteriaceae bacterium]
MKYLDIDHWNRKQHFEHFSKLSDPYFGVVVDVDVTKAYEYAKQSKTPFFVMYLHACMKAINSVENMRYRIQGDKIRIHDVIHASATIAREDTTFGFSFIHYSEDLQIFYKNFQKEKERIANSKDLFPPINSEDCIYCSALPWFSFSGHKEPVSGRIESVPKLAFGKFSKKENILLMPVSIIVNHALVDGYHVGEFFENYQIELDKIG